MAELKTQKTDASVDDFIDAIADETKRADSRVIIKMMQQVTKSKPSMWGPSIIGFGSIRYKYDDGREMDWFTAGFSPRKQAITIYLRSDYDEQKELLSKLGKHKTSKSCLYIKRLSDVDLSVLKELVTESVKHAKAKHK